MDPAHSDWTADCNCSIRSPAGCDHRCYASTSQACLGWQVLKAIVSLPSHFDVADAVHQKVSKSSMNVNHHAQLMQAIKAIPTEHDHDTIAHVVTDRIKKAGVFNVDHTPIIKAIASLPDHDAIADAVHDKISRSTLNVDHSDVVNAIGKIKFEQDHDALADAVHARISTTTLTPDHHDQLIRAIGTLPNHEDIAVAVHERISAHLESFDTTEVLSAVKRIPTEHDHETIAIAVHERLKNAAPMIVDMSEVLQEIRRMKIQPDLAPVLQAIAGLDFSPILEAIGKITMQVSLGGTMVTSQSLASASGSLSARTPPVMPAQSTLRAASSQGYMGTRSSQAADSPQRDLQSPRPSEMSYTPAAVGAEDSPFRCLCGFSCGTQAALERHIVKMAGNGTHGRLGSNGTVAAYQQEVSDVQRTVRSSRGLDW